MIHVIKGTNFIDDRGSLVYLDPKDYLRIFTEAKRFYIVQNHKIGFIRGWHGHLKEKKWAIPIIGTALFGLAEITKENTLINPKKSIISSEGEPTILEIPPGFAHGWKALVAPTILMFLSSSTTEESKMDDYRFSLDIHSEIFKEIER